MTFTRISQGAIINDGGNYRECNWGDFNNDGWLDIFVATGTGYGDTGYDGNFLYNNNGDPNESGDVTFTPIITGSIVKDVGNSHGCSWDTP